MTKTFQGSVGNSYRIIKELGRGGQGIVYLCERETDNSRCAVKWYKKTTATLSQRNRILSLINRGAPETFNSEVTFIWPIELVEMEGKSEFGYVMPVIDSDKFVHNNKVARKRVAAPSLKTLARISFNIATALDALHAAGLAYCDINLGNIQIDCESGCVIICDNDNVVPNNTEAEIFGMVDFMAPEVAKNDERPSAVSDLYSLAILFYQLWTWEHPMEGALTAKIRSWDELAKRKFYRDEPIFCHDPNDKRNAAELDPVLQTSVARWNKLCSEKMKGLFLRAFTTGIHTPNRRPSSEEWKRAFLELFQNAAPCLSCGRDTLYENSSEALRCAYCAEPITATTVLVATQPTGKMTISARIGAEILAGNIEHSVSGEGLSNVIGRLEKHPKKRGMIIRNLSDRTWFYQVETANYEIKPGEARALVKDGIIQIGGATLTIESSNGQ